MIAVLASFLKRSATVVPSRTGANGDSTVLVVHMWLRFSSGSSQKVTFRSQSASSHLAAEELCEVDGDSRILGHRLLLPKVHVPIHPLTLTPVMPSKSKEECISSFQPTTQQRPVAAGHMAR